MGDAVNHPDHYNWMDIECIDVVQHFNFNLGNAIKYIWRAGWKDSKTHIEDLEKAKFYIEQEIGLLKAKALHPATKPTGESPVKAVRDAYDKAAQFQVSTKGNYGIPINSYGQRCNMCGTIVKPETLHSCYISPSDYAKSQLMGNTE